MERWERKRQSVWCAVLVVIGIIVLYIIYQYNDMYQKEVTTTIDGVQTISDTEEKQQSHLDMQTLYAYREKDCDIKVIDEIARQLIASSYLIGVQLEKQERPYKIILSYNIPSKGVNFSKIKKDQIALCNATAFMCIFDEIDTIAVEIAFDEIKEEKIVYRPDIEDYFKLKKLSAEDKLSFDRLVGEFLNADKVTLYNQITHPYSSRLGKDVEKYFKWYFYPQPIEESLVIPTKNEEMENELEAKYGYLFYLEGLKKDNDLINYYCINKLRHYYYSPHVEEILIELVACKNRSRNEQVRLACDRTKEILAYRGNEAPLLFTLFDQIEEADKLYTINEQSEGLLAKWEGNNKGSIKVISISHNGTYALCRVESVGKYYTYSLPIKLEADGLVKPYILKEEGVLLEGNRVLPELNTLILQSNPSLEQKLKTSQDTEVFKWLEGPFIKVGERTVYDCKNSEVLSVDSYHEYFSTSQFIDILQDQYRIDRKEEATNRLAGGQAIALNVEGESVIVYEFEDENEKEKVMTKNQSFLRTRHYWHRGKLIVIYNGESGMLINNLNRIFRN